MFDDDDTIDSSMFDHVEWKEIHPPSTEALIIAECDNLKQLLLEKNKSYGDSALKPLRIFSMAGPHEQLRVRIDDKLSRLARGHEIDDDTIKDLIGYLILLRIAMRQSDGA